MLVVALAGDGRGEGEGDFGASSLSSVSTTLPSLTLSPTFTATRDTVPAAGAGTSIVALSDSSVTRESSTST